MQKILFLSRTIAMRKTVRIKIKKYIKIIIRIIIIVLLYYCLSILINSISKYIIINNIINIYIIYIYIIINI